MGSEASCSLGSTKGLRPLQQQFGQLVRQASFAAYTYDDAPIRYDITQKLGIIRKIEIRKHKQNHFQYSLYTLEYPFR